MILQQLINGIVIGSVYALIAMGATLVYGILKVLDIANAGAYAIGAYAGLFLYQATGSLPVAFLGAVLFTGLFGVLVQRVLYVPLLDKPPLVPLICSIGLFIFIQDLIRLLAGPHIRAFEAQLPFRGIELPYLSVNAIWIAIMATTAVLLVFLWYMLNRTKLGLAWKSTAQDLEIAKAMGVNVDRVVAFNFLLGYGFAAAAGIMIGMLYNSVFPTMGDMPAYKMLAIIVLGGLGNPLGTVVAGLLIGVVETLVAGYVGFFLPRDAIAFVVLIVILLVRPQGLLGQRT